MLPLLDEILDPAETLMPPSVVEIDTEPSTARILSRLRWRAPDAEILPSTSIGNPDGFRRTLERLGVNVAAWRTFADHHPYSREDIDELRRWARQQPTGAALVTTQKDLVKINLDRLGDRELWALRIRLRVLAGEEALEKKLRMVISV